MANENLRLAIMAPPLNLCNDLFGVEGRFFLREGLEVGGEASSRAQPSGA